VLFVENDEQLDKALEVRERLPLLRKIVVIDMEGLRGLDDADVIGLNALRELGRGYLQQHAGELERRSAACGQAIWRSWSIPRAPPANPRARCTRTAPSPTPCAATTP
jgi:hypothetical protein